MQNASATTFHIVTITKEPQTILLYFSVEGISLLMSKFHMSVSLVIIVLCVKVPFLLVLGNCPRLQPSLSCFCDVAMTAKTVMKGCMPILKPTAEGEVPFDPSKWKTFKEQCMPKYSAVGQIMCQPYTIFRFRDYFRLIHLKFGPETW